MESKGAETVHETVHDAFQHKALRSTMGVWSLAALAVVLPGYIFLVIQDRLKKL